MAMEMDYFCGQMTPLTIFKNQKMASTMLKMLIPVNRPSVPPASNQSNGYWFSEKRLARIHVIYQGFPIDH